MNLFKVKDKEIVTINTDSLAKFNIVPIDTTLLEREVEDFLYKYPEVFFKELVLYIGRQVHTSNNKIIDLLAIDKDARIIVIELKRNKAPRDIVAQILDYTSWLSQLSEDELNNITKKYIHRDIKEAFESYFNLKYSSVSKHEVIGILVAQKYPKQLLDSISFLIKSGISIRVIKYSWLKDVSGGDYFSISEIFSDSGEYLGESLTSKDSKVLKNKAFLKEIFNKIKIYIENEHFNCANNLQAKFKGFKVVQEDGGGWTSVSGEWKIEEGFVHILFAIDLLEKKTPFLARVSLPKKYNLESRNHLEKYLINHGFSLEKNKMGGFWNKHFSFRKNLHFLGSIPNMNTSEQFLMENVKRELPVLMKFVNNLIPLKLED